MRVSLRASVIACIGHVAVVIRFDSVGSAGATLGEGDMRGYVLIVRSGVAVVGALAKDAVVALAVEARAEPVNLRFAVVAIADHHLEPLRERLCNVGVKASCPLLVLGVYLCSAGVGAVAHQQVRYPVAAEVAAVWWVHGAILETAGAATSLEIACAVAVVAYGVGAKEQVLVASRWGLVKADDRINDPVLASAQR